MRLRVLPRVQRLVKKIENKKVEKVTLGKGRLSDQRVAVHLNKRTICVWCVCLVFVQVRVRHVQTTRILWSGWIYVHPYSLKQ